MTGSGSLTIKNFSSDQFGIRILKMDHYIHIGNNLPIGRPQKLVEPSNVRPLYFLPVLWTRE